MKKYCLSFLLVLFAADMFADEKSVLNFHVVDASVSSDDLHNLQEGLKVFSYFDSKAHEMKTAVTSQTVSFDSSTIESIKLINDVFGFPCIEIDFNMTGADLLDKLTGSSIGKNLIMETNGSVIFNAMVRERISGGKLSVSNCGNEPLYEVLLNFDCENQTTLRIPEKLVCLKEGKNYKTYADDSADNVTQLAAAFFLSVFTKNDASYEEYILPDSLQTMEVKVKSFRNNFRDCTIYAAETESLKKSLLKIYKGRDIQVPLYIYIDNGTYHIHESLIFVIDDNGRLKIQDIK